MKPVPWSYIESWNCIECGMCCKDYRVVLALDEWAKIAKTYGFESTNAEGTRLYLSKKRDKTCYFLTSTGDSCVCGLQYSKPKACKIWPFKVFASPKFGMAKQAYFRYQNRDLFIYVDMACSGLSFGHPSQDYMTRILPEFIEVAADLRENQVHSTSKLKVNKKSGLSTGSAGN